MSNHDNNTFTRTDDNSRIALTYTYGMIENGVRMQQIGELEPRGYTLKDLKGIRRKFRDMSIECRLLALSRALPLKEYDDDRHQDAAILIIHNGIDKLLGEGSADMLLEEQKKLKWDKHKFMRGRVVNSIARYNLCYSDFSQEPNYNKGMGRVIDFNDLPLTSKLRTKLMLIIPFPKHDDDNDEPKLNCEGNYYYRPSCGIGFHGDGERKTVICASLGATTQLDYQWFQDNKSIGERVSLDINHSDIYVMSEKATGNDWLKKKDHLCTLRHAAGDLKYRTTKK